MNDVTNPMDAMVSRQEQLIDAWARSMMRTAEIAAERVELAAEIAAARQRMNAFGAVLESIAAQKQAVHELMTKASPAAKAMYTRNLKMLDAQEVAVLKRAGFDEAEAVKAIEAADTPAPAPALPPGATEVIPAKRGNKGRFSAVHANGKADTN